MCLHHVVPECHLKSFIPSKKQEISNCYTDVRTEQYLLLNSDFKITCLCNSDFTLPSELLWSQSFWIWQQQQRAVKQKQLHFTSRATNFPNDTNSTSVADEDRATGNT